MSDDTTQDVSTTEQVADTASVTEPAEKTAESPADKPASQEAPKEEKAEDSKPVAPEKYEFKESESMDASVLEKFSEVAKELNLPQDSAQKILDKVRPQMQAAQEVAVQKMREEWAATAKSDKEYGGDKFDSSMAGARQAMEKFTTPEFREFLDQSGLGSHPEMIRTFVRISKATSEDKVVTEGRPANSRQSLLQAMYPNQN